MNSVRTEALRLLTRRELSVRQLRDKLMARGHPAGAVDTVILELMDRGLLDDRRVADAYVRTASSLKGRGPLRIRRELQRIGIPREIADAAVAGTEASDERAAIGRALQRKLRSAPLPSDRQQRARLYRFLVRQGFSSSAIATALGGSAEDGD